ncbi:TPA: hypothetical protein ACXLB5_003963 [Pseudomonas aeruginosa]
MSIDWSKAPEGANKAGFTGPDNYLQFYRIPGMFGDYDYWSDGRGWLGSDFPTCANQLFERPAKVEWDGQGLPPVGIQIEAKFPVTDVTGTHYHWRRVIVAVAGIPRAERECLVYDAENTKPAWVDEFRPLRTPEQVAAAERWAAIQQMLAFADVKYGAGELMSMKEYVETAVAALYDAGYRRQESST